jgi:hypothetical protein
MTGNVIPLPEPLPRLRPDVPPFDPDNPAQLRAWEAIFDFGRVSQKWKGCHE